MRSSGVYCYRGLLTVISIATMECFGGLQRQSDGEPEESSAAGPKGNNVRQSLGQRERP